MRNLILTAALIAVTFCAKAQSEFETPNYIGVKTPKTWRYERTRFTETLYCETDTLVISWKDFTVKENGKEAIKITDTDPHKKYIRIGVGDKDLVIFFDDDAQYLGHMYKNLR